MRASSWDAELRTSIPIGIVSYVAAIQTAPGAESIIGASGALVNELLKRYHRLSAVEAEVLDAIAVAAFPIVSNHCWLSPLEILDKSEMFPDIEALTNELRSMTTLGILQESAGKWRLVW